MGEMATKKKKREKFDSIWADNKIKWKNKKQTKQRRIIIHLKIESKFYDDVSAIHTVPGGPVFAVFICCMRHINETLSSTNIRRLFVAFVCVFGESECCLKFGAASKNIFELMTDLMRKMKLTACHAASGARRRTTMDRNVARVMAFRLQRRTRHIFLYSK